MALLSRNVGTIDRSLRIGAGVLLIALAARQTIGPWGYFGIVPLLTGAIGSFPLYTPIGMSTCSKP